MLRAVLKCGAEDTSWCQWVTVYSLDRPMRFGGRHVLPRVALTEHGRGQATALYNATVSAEGQVRGKMPLRKGKDSGFVGKRSDGACMQRIDGPSIVPHTSIAPPHHILHPHYTLPRKPHPHSILPHKLSVHTRVDPSMALSASHAILTVAQATFTASGRPPPPGSPPPSHVALLPSPPIQPCLLSPFVARLSHHPSIHPSTPAHSPPHLHEPPIRLDVH